MKQEWGKTQFVKISIDEIFAFQDKLDAVKDEPEKVWQIVDEFFWEAENQLELSPGFLEELQKLDLEKDFVPIKDIDNLFDDEDDFESNYATAKEYVQYVLRKQKEEEKKKYDIPFTPTHIF